MPTSSIDTFFACTIIVSAAVIATVFFASTMQTRIGSFQDLNKNGYLQMIADQIVSSCGTPADWGSNGTLVPTCLGLSRSGSSRLYELDTDKICRLNSQNAYALSYFELSNAARLNEIAFGLSLSQLLTITIDPSGNTTSEDLTTYAFTVSVTQSSGPVTASLRCYLVAENFVGVVSTQTSDSGVGYVNAQLPNSASGPALLVVFARASFDDRMTSYAVYSFSLSSQKQSPDETFLILSPLNCKLNANPVFSTTSIESGYAFSYGYQSNLLWFSNSSFDIPDFVDKSPTLLVVYGVNDSVPFVQWTSYPQVPLQIGADFSNSEQNMFTYIVTIGETLYKLDISFGDVNT